MLLQVKGVSFSYGSVRALQHVSFSAQAGQIVGLIGENGAGKSTMIKNITRHLTPQQGVIAIEGIPVNEIRNEDFPVSYIPETPVFYEELTVLEHLHLSRRYIPGPPGAYRRSSAFSNWKNTLTRRLLPFPEVQDRDS